MLQVSKTKSALGSRLADALFSVIIKKKRACAWQAFGVTEFIKLWDYRVLALQVSPKTAV